MGDLGVFGWLSFWLKVSGVRVVGLELRVEGPGLQGASRL